MAPAKTEPEVTAKFFATAKFLATKSRHSFVELMYFEFLVCEEKLISQCETGGTVSLLPNVLSEAFWGDRVFF